ncbi:Galactosyltransferase [Handroanthus impetiginosus]|uniref:Galactosyltransferase n=1 Tax=Handroanthus impetiginosus TaxID=429701 RepID=A0A2G9I7U5_9LAMI|nr:Galactosyltransferase [Handroanthus impetiginosus]
MDVFGGLCRTFLILLVVFYFAFIFLSKKAPLSTKTETLSSPTNLSHLVFGLVGSEKAWHHRKAYIESWWRPNITRGFLFLDKPPTGDLLPWSHASPSYKISDDLTKFINKKDVTAQRIIHSIMEVYREDHENLRWLVMGDDDSIFFVDNMVDVLAQYDHTKYYYFGGHSEFILSNYWYSFSQGFGGAGFILSYPLAKVLAGDMENCMNRYRHLNAADLTTMACISDIGVSLTALKGIHQIDLRGDISCFLSSHPKFPLMSLHHFDVVEPIFPSMDRSDSTPHLMKAAAVDQSRMLQQTIYYQRQSNWSFSISWGYSVHVYEKIMPRSYLQYPIETFRTWQRSRRPPHYMFNTRLPSSNPCEAPHIFFYETIKKTPENEILTSFSRAWPRGLPACSSSGNDSADSISRILVHSPARKRFQVSIHEFYSSNF